VPFNPDPELCEDEVYREKELQNLVKSHKKSKEDAKQEFDERKSGMMQTIEKENTKRMKKARRDARKEAKKALLNGDTTALPQNDTNKANEANQSDDDSNDDTTAQKAGPASEMASPALDIATEMASPALDIASEPNTN